MSFSPKDRQSGVLLPLQCRGRTAEYWHTQQPCGSLQSTNSPYTAGFDTEGFRLHLSFEVLMNLRVAWFLRRFYQNRFGKSAPEVVEVATAAVQVLNFFSFSLVAFGSGGIMMAYLSSFRKGQISRVLKFTLISCPLPLIQATMNFVPSNPFLIGRNIFFFA